MHAASFAASVDMGTCMALRQPSVLPNRTAVGCLCLEQSSYVLPARIIGELQNTLKTTEGCTWVGDVS